MNSPKPATLHVSPALLRWEDLWPRGVQAAAKGWTEAVQPGVTLLLDETGDDAGPWLDVLTGQVLPMRGFVECAGLNTQTDAQAYQSHVFRHNPRTPQEDPEISASQWIQRMEQQWPTWNTEQWQVHCEGFGLGLHMSKPLSHLSAGSLRKLGIAAALASGARLTVIQEPIAALDSESIRYLCKALDALGEDLAEKSEGPRWVVVAHWEPLPGVTWDEVLAAPSWAPA